MTPVVAQGNRDAIRIVGDKIWCWLSRCQKTMRLLRPCQLGWVSPQPLPGQEDNQNHTEYDNAAHGRLLPTNAPRLWNLNQTIQHWHMGSSLQCVFSAESGCR